MMHARYSALVIALLLTSLLPGLSGCDIVDPEPSGGELFEGMTAVPTENAQFPFVAIHQDGEMLGVVADPASGAVTGGIYINNDIEDEVVVTFGPNGMPERLVMGDEAVVFDNVRADKLDLVLIRADGSIQVARDVPFDVEEAQAAASAMAAYARTGANGGFIEGLRAARLGVSIATCSVGTAMIAGAIIATGPIGALLFGSTVAGCSSALFSVIQQYHQRHGTDDAIINGTAEYMGNASEYINLLSCSAGDPGGCIESGLFVLDVAASNAEAAEAALAAAIQQAQALLENGGGDVQVSLTWNTTADIDLWVTDPDGERIYYGNRNSASGGQLDRDDVDGMGPENIFWPTGGAPSGTYLVDVDHFSGASPTSFTVVTVVQGVVRRYPGTIVDNQTLRVATFSIAGVQPSAPAAASVRARTAPRRETK